MSFDVRACRMTLGLTQKELAAKLDTTIREITRWEAVDPKKRHAPLPFFVRKMQRLEREKLTGVSERPGTPTPWGKRTLPEPSAGTGTVARIGIAPSSY